MGKTARIFGCFILENFRITIFQTMNFERWDGEAASRPKDLLQEKCILAEFITMTMGTSHLSPGVSGMRPISIIMRAGAINTGFNSPMTA